MGSVGRTVKEAPGTKTVAEAAEEALSTKPKKKKEILKDTRVFKNPTKKEKAPVQKKESKPKTPRLPRFLSTTNDYETTVTQTGNSTLVDLGPSDVTKAHITALEKAGFKRRGKSNDTWYR